MKLTSSLLVLAIAGGVAPLAEAGQQGLEMEWRQKARPDPVILDGCGGLTCRNARLDPIAPPNHLHVNIRPPTQAPVEILASNNLTATGPVLADAGSSITTAAQKEKYDAAFSVCGAAVPTTHRDYDLANDLSPLTAAYGYFYKLGITPAEGPTNVTIIVGPSHGELSTKGLVLGAYRYIPNEGYLGPDQMTFVVEWMGKKFKVIETVWVANTAPENGGCPTDYKLPPANGGNGKRGALDIIELPVDGAIDSEALAKLHGIISFSMGAGLFGSVSSLNFADLQGAAIGQTTGSNITLDTNAANYNWYIDPTPGQNEEYLPTSNPNEWVAKAGSDAAGKMDMLSVLLHEYGHTLGINHNSDSHDYMATNLGFDLIGFGANGNHVTVRDVRLSGLPQLHDETAMHIHYSKRGEA